MHTFPALSHTHTRTHTHTPPALQVAGGDALEGGKAVVAASGAPMGSAKRGVKFVEEGEVGGRMS